MQLKEEDVNVLKRLGRRQLISAAVGAAIAVLIVGCERAGTSATAEELPQGERESAPAQTAYPTYTQYPTFTPYPTCAPCPSATPAPTVAAASYATAAPDEGRRDLCDWFVQTQLIRAERIAGLTELGEYYAEYGTADYGSLDLEVLEEFVGILERYRPHQQRFVDQWTALGAHPDGAIFYARELEAVRLRMRAFQTVVDGYEQGDWDLFDSGIALATKAGSIGREGEEEGMRIRAICAQ